jgi:hypothetical protein
MVRFGHTGAKIITCSMDLFDGMDLFHAIKVMTLHTSQQKEYLQRELFSQNVS